MTEPYFASGPVTLYHGDCIEVMRELPDASVHAVVTDPPYGLEFMGKDWDGADGFRRSLNAADASRDSVFGRTSKRAPEYNTGRGARVAQERAAELTEKGNGHSTSAGPYLAAGVDSIRVAGLPFQEWCAVWAAECLRVLKPGGYMLAFGGSRTWHRLSVAIEDAGFEIRDSIAWLYGSGFPKSLDVSKAIDKRPGVERHPEFAAELRTAIAAAGYTNTFDVAEKVIGRRTGAVANWQKYQWPDAKWWPGLRDLLGMDGAKWDAVIAEAERVKTGEHTSGLRTGASGVGGGGAGADRFDNARTEKAKAWEGWGTALKPAFEPIVVARKPLLGTVAANVLAHGTGALNIDAGRIEAPDSEAYAAKDLGRWPTNVVLDKSQAEAMGTQSRFFPTFRYEAKAGGDERPDVDGVQHPTVKPIALMQWLVRLVSSPGAVILEPFAGSGTTLEAAVIEGFDVIGIERDETYLPLIMQRLSKPHEQALDLGDIA